MVAISNERNNTPDQILVGLLTDAQEGDILERIPEHVTLVPWFDVQEKYQSAFQNSLMNLTHETSPIELRGRSREMFGPEHDIPVTKLHLGSLAMLHSKLLLLIERYEGRVDSTYIGDRYAAHVTDTDTFSLQPGESHPLRRIQLISREGKGGARKIEKVFNLTGGTHGAPTARF